MQMLLQWFGLVISGVLLSFAHAFRYDDIVRQNSWWTWLVASLGLFLFINLAPRSRAGLPRFLRGFVGGFIYFAITLYWLVNALTIFGGLSLWLAVIIAALLWAYCALFMGAWAWIAGLDTFEEKSPFVKSVAWAAAWTSLEVIRQFLFTGFHWGELGYHFDYFSGLRETASIWGVHGLTFAWIFLISLVLQIDQILKDRGQKMALTAVGGIFLAGVVFTQFHLRSLPRPDALKVAILQPDIPQSEKWDPSQIGPITEKILGMTQTAIGEGADLVVWPETAYPRLISSSQRQLPFSVSKPVVMGAVVRDATVNKNSALLIDKDQILSRFDKIHLVPFGEYVPFQEWLPFKKLVANVGDFKPGEKNQDLLVLPDGKTKLGPLICYEDIFNRSSVRHAKSGASFFVNLTNDAWYGVSSAQEQHFAMSSFQVYQSFIPMVRATNNGWSALITPHERISVPNFSEQIAHITVPTAPKAPFTFFVWTYPLMEWIWIFIFAIAAGWKRSQTKRIFFR